MSLSTQELKELAARYLELQEEIEVLSKSLAAKKDLTKEETIAVKSIMSRSTNALREVPQILRQLKHAAECLNASRKSNLEMLEMLQEAIVPGLRRSITGHDQFEWVMNAAMGEYLVLQMEVANSRNVTLCHTSNRTGSPKKYEFTLKQVDLIQR